MAPWIILIKKINRLHAAIGRNTGNERTHLGRDTGVEAEVPEAASVLDAIQIPAFLCRQTDLLVAAGATGKPVNVKKGQFLSPSDVAPLIAKVASTGNGNILVTERGSTFGYGNLVVDMRAIPAVADFGVPVVFDATHAVQLPGGLGSRSGGEREFAPVLARAAIAAGCHGVFMEVHPNPDTALCDGPNMIPLNQVEKLLRHLKRIFEVTHES